MKERIAATAAILLRSGHQRLLIYLLSETEKNAQEAKDAVIAEIKTLFEYLDKLFYKKRMETLDWKAIVLMI